MEGKKDPSEASQMDTKAIYSKSLVAKVERPHANCESNAVDACGPEASMLASCNMDVSCISEEELVYTSCSILGLPMPGLLKSELQNYAQSKLLPLPTYNVSQTAGPGNKMIYFCTLRVGSMEFCGRLAYSKREAEISAAIQAISHLFKGEDCGEGNI